MSAPKLLLVLIFVIHLTSCEDRYDFPLQQKGDYYHQEFQWDYAGHHFAYHLNVETSIYDYYHNLPKGAPYVDYTNEYPEYRYQEDIAETLLDIAKQYHFTKRQTAEFALVFIQSIGYTSDPPAPHGWTRYLIEVLMERRQDCNCAAVAVASLWRAMGFYSALIVIPTQRHMAAGVCINDDSDIYYVGESGRHYLFGEATSLGWALSQSSHPNDSVIIYEVLPLYPCINSPYQKAHIRKASRNNGGRNNGPQSTVQRPPDKRSNGYFKTSIS